MARYLSLAAFAAMVAVASSFGAMFMPDAWYGALDKPAWTPPGWVFGPVWTVLYVMIALAGWRAWQAEGASPAIGAWCVQLVLNAAWSFLMFGRKDISFALADIVLLWLAIVVFIILIRKSSQVAAGLFVPYLAWVTFAALLNFEIWRLNP